MSFLGDGGVSFNIKSTLVHPGRVIQSIHSWTSEHVTPDFLHGQFFLLLQCVWHLQGMTASTVKGEGYKSISEEDLSEMRANGELIEGLVVTVTGEID